MANWSDLPTDLIGEIAKRVDTVEDLVAFSGVCRSWRSAVMKENWIPGRQLPWLVLAESEEAAANNRSRRFLNFCNNKRYNIDIPELRGCRIWGSSDGWIYGIGLDRQMHLVNPLTRSKLTLPPQSTFKHQQERPPGWYRQFFFCKVIVLKRPKTSGDEEILVAAVYGEFYFLAIARPGDQAWTEVEPQLPLNQNIYKPHLPLIQDIVCCNGQIFALRNCGALWQFNDEPNPPSLIVFAPKLTGVKLHFKAYLVESVGDLLMVVRYMDLEFDYKTVDFVVYKMDFESREWKELESLGERALFVGDSCSLSLSSTEVVGCQGNCIYFTDDYYERWDEPEVGYGGHDLGVFNLEEVEVHPIPHDLTGEDLISSFSPPVWMMPSLF